jgi:hypothetical protein
MKDYFLKFSSKAVAEQALKAAGFVSQNTLGQEFIQTASETVAIDLVGDIVLSGQYSSNGDQLVEVVAPVVIPGYHVNIRGELSESQEALLAPYIIEAPKNPYRVFA